MQREQEQQEQQKQQQKERNCGRENSPLECALVRRVLPRAQRPWTRLHPLLHLHLQPQRLELSENPDQVAHLEVFDDSTQRPRRQRRRNM